MVDMKTLSIPDFWDVEDAVVNSGNTGFNGLVRIPILLKKQYSDLRKYDFGFFDKEDRANCFANGWRHLKAEHWPDLDDFNRDVSSRYNINLDAEGCLVFRENYIMIRDKEYGARMLQERLERDERAFSASATESSPTERREYEEKTVQPIKRGPGRPKKNEE